MNPSPAPGPAPNHDAAALRELLGFSSLKVSHYRFFNLPDFEAHPEKLQAALQRRIVDLKSHRAGPHAALAEKLLAHAAQLRSVLADPAKKAAYDRQLLLEQEAAKKAAEAPPARATSSIFRAQFYVDLARKIPKRARPQTSSEWLYLGLGGGFVILVFGVLIVYVTSGSTSLPKKRPVAQQPPGPAPVATAAPEARPTLPSSTREDDRRRAQQLVQEAQALASQAAGRDPQTEPQAAAKLYQEAASKIQEALPLWDPVLHAASVQTAQQRRDNWLRLAADLEQRKRETPEAREAERLQRIASAEARDLVEQAKKFQEQKQFAGAVQAWQAAQEKFRAARLTLEADDLKAAVAAAQKQWTEEFERTLAPERAKVREAFRSQFAAARTNPQLADTLFKSLEEGARTAENVASTPESLALRLESLELAVEIANLSRVKTDLEKISADPGVPPDVLMGLRDHALRGLEQKLVAGPDLLALSQLASTPDQARALVARSLQRAAENGQFSALGLTLDQLREHPHATAFTPRAISELLTVAEQQTFEALPRGLSADSARKRQEFTDFVERNLPRHVAARDYAQAEQSLDRATTALQGINGKDASDRRKQLQTAREGLEAEAGKYRKLATLRAKADRTSEENRNLAWLSLEFGDADSSPPTWAEFLAALHASGEPALQTAAEKERAAQLTDVDSLLAAAGAWEALAGSQPNFRAQFLGRSVLYYRRALVLGVKGIQKTQVDLALSAAGGIADWGPDPETLTIANPAPNLPGIAIPAPTMTDPVNSRPIIRTPENPVPEKTAPQVFVDLLNKGSGLKSLRGTFEIVGETLLTGAEDRPRIAFPFAADEKLSYDLSVRFRREEGNDTISLMIPVGPAHTTLLLSSVYGRESGVFTSGTKSFVDGKLDNRVDYQLDVSVRVRNDEAEIQAALNARPYFAWAGKCAELTYEPDHQLPNPRQFGLGTNQKITLLAYRVRPLGGSLTKVEP